MLLRKKNKMKSNLNKNFVCSLFIFAVKYESLKIAQQQSAFYEKLSILLLAHYLIRRERDEIGFWSSNYVTIYQEYLQRILLMLHFSSLLKIWYEKIAEWF